MRIQWFRVLRDATQLRYDFHNSHCIFCHRFLFFWRNCRSFPVFYSVVHQPYGARTNTYPRLYIPFQVLKKLTLGTRVQVPFKKVSAQLSKNDTRTTFCLGNFSSWTHFELVSLMAQKVWRHSVSVCVHDRHFYARSCTGFSSNVGFFLSTGNRYLFLLQRHLIPFDS